MTRTLIDTQVLLWALAGSTRLTPSARERMQAAQAFVSAVSIWEISIKYSAGKLAAIPSEVVGNALAAGFKLLPISSEHAVEVAKLPYKHRDPFDRMLIAQAMSESMILLTNDAALTAYGDVVALV